MTIYIIREELSKRLDNLRYVDRYINFIFNCIEDNKFLLKTYTENHHILPKCYWPEYSDIKIHNWNKAKLTARQHYIAHIMLANMFGGKMWLALDRMTAFSPDHKRNYFVSSKIYKKVRQEKSKCLSEIFSDGSRSGKNNPMYGRRDKKSPLYGIKRSEETKKKQSKARKDTHKIISCPVCKIEGDSRMMKVWHFDNCGKLDRNTGAKNGKAKIINIYDANGILKFKCHGNFSKICRENKIPRKPLSFSHKNGGVPIMTSNLSIHYAKRHGLTEFIGWYALEEE